MTNYEMIKNNEVPTNCYVHGRNRSNNLNTGYVLQCSKDLDVARQYATSKGTVWMFEVSGVVLDMSLDATRSKVIERLKHDYENGNCSYELDYLINACEQDWQGLEDELNPEDIVMSAEMWDAPEFVEWFCERYDADMIITNDGALVLNHKNVRHTDITNLVW